MKDKKGHKICLWGSVLRRPATVADLMCLSVSGKAESAADHVIHSGKLVDFPRDIHAHDVGANSYHRYKEDVAMAAKLKVGYSAATYVRLAPAWWHFFFRV